MKDEVLQKACLIASSFILLSFIPFYAHAGAWTQDEGQGQLIATADFYRANERFGNQGNTQSQPAYTKYELNPYVEYGLYDGLTIGGDTFLQRLHDDTGATTGLGDTDLFVRKRLYQADHYVISIQPEIKLPSPEAYSSHTPAIGSEHVDFGARALAGTNGSLLGYSYYTDTEAAYRHRSGAEHDQYLLSATLGVRAADKITIMPQVFQTLRAGSAGNGAFTESPRDDYDLTEIQLSGLYDLSKGRSVQLGVFDAVAGQNAGKGEGVLIAFWKRF